MFLRIAYITLSLTTFTSIALAGDDEKKGNENDKDKPKTIKKDTILNVDVNKAATDDTLVFEDWEKPGNAIDDDNEKSVAVVYDASSSQSAIKFETNEPIIEVEPIIVPIEIIIYPNPTTEILHFTTPETPESVRIIGLNGCIQNVKIYSQSVDVSHLPQGTYFIQLIFTNRIESRKFMKS